MCADLCAWSGHWRFFYEHAPGLEQQIPLQVKQASPHRSGGFSQVVYPQHLDASGQVKVITPGDRHAAATGATSLLRPYPSEL